MQDTILIYDPTVLNQSYATKSEKERFYGHMLYQFTAQFSAIFRGTGGQTSLYSRGVDVFMASFAVLFICGTRN